jgi:hypothetical protein
MMEAVSASEMLVNTQQTTNCNIPKDSHFHNHPHENPKSHLLQPCQLFILMFCGYPIHRSLLIESMHINEFNYSKRHKIYVFLYYKEGSGTAC